MHMLLIFSADFGTSNSVLNLIHRLYDAPAINYIWYEL